MISPPNIPNNAEGEVFRIDNKEEAKINITVKSEGNVIFEDTAYAGTFALVKTIEAVNPKTVKFEGEVRHLTWGNPVAILFGFNALNSRLKNSQILLAGKTVMKELENMPEDHVIKYVKSLNRHLHIED